MKLRNKKTGGLANILNDDQDFIRVYTDAGWHDYDSLAELNEEWEDYKPAEPLIKDEPMREAIRAWANYCGWESFIVCNDHFNNCYLVGYKGNNSSRLEFNNTIAGASKSRRYTLAELCGEEEE